MSLIFDEAESDELVNAILAKHKNNKEIRMFIKDENGVICEVIEAVDVSRDDLVAELESAKNVVTERENILAEYDKLANPPADQVVAPPVPEPTPEPTPEPAPVVEPTPEPAPVEAQAPIIVQ